MGKKFSGVSQTMSRFRGWIQAGATLLTNLHLPNFLKGGLYQGAGKTVCMPGLNCYSCPAASGACPIGAFQAVVGSSKFSFSYYITGFLILLGVLLGRFICGFLCPFGWFQELLHMYSYSYSTSFDGEGAITSAIDYVVNEEQPKLYLVEGHGEADLPSTFAEQVEKDNIETESLSLLHTETIPEDADCLMIYAPESDISEDERDLLAEYVSGGGKLLVIAGPTREDGVLENLYSLLSDYGVEPAEGIVVESDSNYYSAFSGPAALLPQLQSDDITNSLIGSNYSVIMPIALGLIVDDSASGTVTELLTTSGTSFSKAAGYAMSTYDYEDGDIDGPFATGVSIQTSGGGEMVWFTSSYFLEDAYNASSSGANGDLVMNALADMIGESEAMAIRSKSLNYDYLSISGSTASLLKVLMIGAFPLAYLGIGVGVVLTRRRKQNEAV